VQILCKVSDVDDEEPLKVEVADGRAFAVFKWDGQFYCVDDLCSHGEASLAEGYVEDGEIVCPYHLGSFCIHSGEARKAPCHEPIGTYSVTVVDGVLTIDD
jgi:nitrite reductase/ring-hydroxylating ferredoxin subunit